jgi:hypothetical protein
MEAVNKRLASQDEEIRSLRAELQTRAAVPQIEVREGAPGRDGVDGKDGAPGRDGIDGKDGRDGVDGPPGERGADGINGRDGSPGERGERGADGVATREEIESIATRAVEARFAEVQTRSWLDTYQGTYDPKHGTYARSSTVTWDGSLWGAFSDTDKQPGTQDSGWKLITKRGRDGRDRK